MTTIDKKSIIKAIKNEYKIYIILMIIMFIIRIIPLSSGSSNIDTIINEISIGSFTSTFVAFLITWHDNNRIKREKLVLCVRITESFYSALFNYLACMDLIRFGNKLTDLSECRSFVEEDIDFKNNWADNIDLWTFQALKIMQSKIRSNAKEITTLDISYIDNKIISLEDIDAITNIQNCIKESTDGTDRLGFTPQTIFCISHEHLIHYLSQNPKFLNKLIKMYPQYYIKYKYGEIVSEQAMFYI